MHVQAVKTGGIVSSVVLVGPDGEPVPPVTRFLRYVLDSGRSPNTALAYGYDLRLVFEFFAERGIDWREFRPSLALELLGWLRRRPVRGPAQRLGLSSVGSGGRLLVPSSVARVLAAVWSFYDWAIVAELVTGENPMRRRRDVALAMVAERHRPFMGNASRQQPVSREVRVRLPHRLPRPMSESEVTALLESMTCLRDLTMVLLMLDGALLPGEMLGLQLGHIAYGRRRVTIRKRDDHPRGVRAKSRHERVVDLLEPRTLDAVNRYVLHERPVDAPSPFVFLVGGRGARRCEPLSYARARADVRPAAGHARDTHGGHNPTRPAAYARDSDVGGGDAGVGVAATPRTRLTGVDPDLHPGLRPAGS